MEIAAPGPPAAGASAAVALHRGGAAPLAPPRNRLSRTDTLDRGTADGAALIATGAALAPCPTTARPTARRAVVGAPRAPIAAVRLRSPQRALLVQPAQDAWVGSARRFASALLAQWRLPADEQDSAVLVVSELAANAAQHGRSDMTLRLSLDRDVLRIAVDDHGDPRPPRPSHRDDDPDEHGRGMQIVGFLAARVETWYGDSGRRVQATLPVARPRLRT